MPAELGVGWVQALDHELLGDDEVDVDVDGDELIELLLVVEELSLDPLASPPRTFARLGGSAEAIDGETGGGVPLNDGGGVPWRVDQSPGGGVPRGGGTFPCGRFAVEGGIGGGVPHPIPAVAGKADEPGPLARPEDDAPLLPPGPLDEPEP